MPDKDPLLLSTYTGLDYKDTLVPVAEANQASIDSLISGVDPITANYLKYNNKQDAGLETPKTFLSDVESQLNPRYDRVRYNYDNEDAYAQAQSSLSKAFNGVTKGVGLFATTFAGGISDVVYGIPSALASGDITKIWNNGVTKALQAFNTKIDNEYLPNYYSNQENKAFFLSPDNLFTANFLFDKLIKNTGFAVGAIYSGNLVGKGLAIGGEAAGGIFSSLAEYTEASKSFSKISSNLARLFSNGKNVEAAEILKRNISSLPELEQANSELLKISQQFNDFNNIQDFTNRTLRAIYSSAGESSFEAIGTSTNIKDKLINDYKSKWGVEDVPKEELDRIDSLSKEAGNTSFLANMAVLSLTEYLQMPKLLGSSYKTSRAAANVFRDTEEVVFDEATKSYIRKDLSKIGKTRNFIGTYLFDPKEATQEFLQNSIDVGVQSYYNKAYRGDETSAWVESFDALNSSISSKQGLESALLGGLTGGLMQAKGKFTEHKIKSNNTNELIPQLPNSTFQQAFQSKLDSSQRHISLQKEGEIHLANNDKLSWMDGKFDQAHNYISTRVKYGRTDLINQDLQERINLSSTQEGFDKLKASGEVSSDMTKEDYTSKLLDFQKQVQNTISLYESTNLMYVGKIKDGRRQYSDETIDKLVYAAAKITNYDDRIPQLTSSLTSKGISTGQVLESLLENSFPAQQVTKEALQQINELNVISPIKDGLKQDLNDIIELSLRRKQFLKEYENIRKNPEDYTSLPIEDNNIAKIKQKNEEGKSVPLDVEVGKEYSINSDGLFRDGNTLSINPKITILSKTLGGEFEVKLPDGSTTFLKPSEFKNYQISESLDNPEELNTAINKIVDEELEERGLESIIAPEDTLQDKLNKINSLSNKVLIDAIQRRVKGETKGIQAELEEKKKKAEKFKNDLELQKKFYNTVLSLEGEQNTQDPDDKSIEEAPKKDLSFIASTGTAQKYEDAAPDSIARREQTFLLNLSTNKELSSKDIKTILVTQKLQDTLELNGIIDPSFPDAIRIVYVQVNEDGSYNFLDKNGSPSTDVNNIAYGTMHDEALQYQGEDNFTNKKNLDAKEIRANYKVFRNNVLAITPEQVEGNIQDYFVPFITSRGFANVVNPNAQNNILDVNLIVEEDLFTPIITIPTIGKTVYGPDNEAVNMPLGKPLYNYRGNLFFLNNRNLTEDEAKNTAKLLLEAFRQLRETGEVNSQLVSYLKGVIYFKTPALGKTPTRNQVYFEEGKLFIGDKGASFNIFTAKEEELVVVLKGLYIYVDNQHLLDFAKNPKNSPFEELSISNDGQLVVTKTWPSYQHYLLQKRTNSSAPLTTNIIIPQEGELPIIQKYPILSLKTLDTKNLVPTQKEQKTIEAPSKIIYDGKTVNIALTSKGESISFTSNGNDLQVVNNNSANDIVARLKASGMTEEEAIDALVARVSDTIIKDRAIIQSPIEVEKKQEEVEQKEIEKPITEKPASKFKPGNFDNSAKRLDIKPFLVKGDVAKEEADVKKMLPNVDVISLKNVINITGGGKAWGAALPHFIYVWENAPYGTRFHEAFEQVFNFILSKKEQKELYIEFKQREGTFTTFENKEKNYSQASFLEAKEQLADEFAEFKTNNRLPIQPKAKSLIQRIWEFLKGLFTGKPLTMEEAFYNLAKGNYANSLIISPIDTTPQYSRTVINTPEALVQDTIIGMTAELFMKKWNEDAALLNQLEEEEEEATKTLFEQLFQGLNKYFEEEGDSTLNAYFYKQLTNDNVEELGDIYDKVQSNWKNVKLQWGNYMADLKSFLKVFDVAFTVTDEGELALASEEADVKEERSQSDYNSDDKLYVNAKNSASKIVKLLFATVADSQFIFETTKNALGNTVSKYLTNQTKRDDNQMYMPNLAPYAKLFNYTLHNASNINGIENIISNLRKVASNKNIKRNANLEVLLNRVGYDRIDPISGELQPIGWTNLSKASRKILLKLENALSKQKPQFFLQYTNNKRENRILATSISDRTQQLKELWVDDIKGSKHVITQGNKVKFKPEAVSEDDFILLSNLGIPFTQTDFNSLSKGNKTQFKETVSKIREDVKRYTTKFLPVDTTSTNVEFAGRLEKLAELYAQGVEGDTTESQHSGPDGKQRSSFILNNYISFILNDTHKANTLEEFKQINPQYNDLYMGDSYILNNLLYQDGQRTDYNIAVAISEGRRSTKDGVPTSKLTYGERLIYEINNNLNDIYYTLLPADSSTEWGLKIRNILSASRYFRGDSNAAIEEYSQLMWKALQNEIALAQDFTNSSTRNSISALSQKEKGRTVGSSLRLFKSILSPKFVEEINQLIDSQSFISEEKYAQFKQELSSFITNRATATITNLKSYQLINEKSDKIEIAAIDTDFIKRNFDKTKISAEQLNSLFFFREANYIFQNIEMHKFLFNDPAQYKDEEKRVKSFLSGREYSNQSVALNDVNNIEFNKSGNYSLSSNEFGYKVYNNKINVQTIASVKTQASNIEEIQKALPGAAGKKYNDNDVADAQSWASPSTYLEMLYKSGGRLTDKQEKLHQWLMAYQRNKMLEKGVLTETEYSEELQNADSQLLKQGIPDVTLPILKPIISGVRNANNVAIQYLYKTSTAPLYYYFVEGTPAEDILLSMQKNNIGLLAMDSAHKVGQLKDHTPHLYNIEGKISDDFTSSSVEIDYKYFGIQVETGATKTYQTQGSQLTKLAVQNLMSNGIPISFKGTTEEWNALAEKDKEKDQSYSLVKRHNAILSEMVVRRAQKTLNKLGIQKGEFGYTYDDRKKVADFILEELTRRELPTNMGVGIEVENNQFKSPLEANVNYRKIKELLWSVIESNITKPKVSGGPKILLSALGYENYKTEIVNGKPVLTSSKYKFYSQKDGKTQACQIAIPFLFGSKMLSQIEKSQNIKFASQKEGFKHVLDYLNNTKNGRNILEGIGFRIPTQGLNSVDFFEIVEFLPPQMGDTVIFPSEITTKAGSDFDVDKMNIYLKNYYLDVNGYPKAIPFYGTDEKAISKISEHALEATLAIPVEADENAVENILQKDDHSVEEMFIHSLENEYYTILKEILSLEQNFARLITPNDANQLKGISREIDKLKTNNKNYELTNHTRLIDSDFMSYKRHLFLMMKQAVGVAAVANTNLALNQVADFRMTIPQKLLEQNFSVRFKYNNTTNNTLSLSETKNKFGDWISDLHSQAIDGTVDVAKDEWLANLLGDANAFSTLLYMFKLGISPKTASLFINQPSIQQYLKLKGIHQNVSKIAYWVSQKYYSAIERDIQKSLNINFKQAKQAFQIKPDIYSDQEMEDAISSKNENNVLQIQMLNDYRGFEQLAKDLFTNIQGYNYDTSRFTSPEVVEDKKLQYQTALITPSITGQTNKILNSSFIHSVKQAVENTNTALSGLLNTQQGEAKKLLNKMALKLSVQFFSKENKVQYLQKAENSLIDYLSQTQAEYTGFKLHQLIPALFLKEGNIAQLLKSAQEHPLLQENLILRNLEAIEDKREGFPSYVRLVEQDYDSYTSNVWTAAFRELKDSNIIVETNSSKRTMANIFDYLMLSQMLQYGSARVRGSFLHLIPNEDYTKLIGPVLDNISIISPWWDNDLFYRNNWSDSNLVPEAQLDTLDDGLTEALAILNNTSLNNLLTQRGYQTTIIKQPYDKRNYPFLKVTSIVRNAEGKIEDYTDKRVSLYRRIDVDDNTPITISSTDPLLGFKETKILYVRVNKLGNENLKEYTETSYLPENKPFNEISNDELTELISLSGINNSSISLTNLVASDEFEDDMLQLEEKGFEEFKNNLPRKNC